MQSEWFDDITLTEEETIEAIAEAKRKKYFKTKNADHWEGEERKAVERKEADLLLARQRRLVIRDEKELMK